MVTDIDCKGRCHGETTSFKKSSAKNMLKQKISQYSWTLTI